MDHVNCNSRNQPSDPDPRLRSDTRPMDGSAGGSPPGKATFTYPHSLERKMKRKPFTAAVSRTIETRAPLVFSFVALVLLLLIWSIGLSYASSSDAGVCPSGDTGEIVAQETVDDSQVESVTMSIDLEEGGVIDVDAPTTDVKIETWEGDEVLVIVEKTKRPTQGGLKSTPAEPINIQVTRKGKDVKIQTTGAENWRENGMDISFRIVLPERFKAGIEQVETGDTMTRLTSTLWRVFQRGALKWIVR